MSHIDKTEKMFCFGLVFLKTSFSSNRENENRNIFFLNFPLVQS